METKKKEFKTGEQVREELTQKVGSFGLEPTMQKPVLDLILEETRQAWIRGKEYGWSKAWNWKRKKAEQSA